MPAGTEAASAVAPARADNKVTAGSDSVGLNAAGDGLFRAATLIGETGSPGGALRRIASRGRSKPINATALTMRHTHRVMSHNDLLFATARIAMLSLILKGPPRHRVHRLEASEGGEVARILLAAAVLAARIHDLEMGQS